MQWLVDVFAGNGAGNSIAHAVLALSLVIVAGVLLGKIKIAGISLGITWILFAGIALGHFGMQINAEVLHFVKEFGLVLFVYSIGLQVGPGFFASFKKGGIQLNMLAASIVVLGVITTFVLHKITGISISTMVGIMSGAVTNTPGLGAAGQAYYEMSGVYDSTIATGYAVAYPLGVVGIIASVILLRYVNKIGWVKKRQPADNQQTEEVKVRAMSLRVENPLLDGKKVGEIHDLINRNYVISRLRHADGSVEVAANPDMVVHTGDDILVVASREAIAAITTLIGREIDIEWKQLNAQLISRRILVTKADINGKSLNDLRISSFGVTITRIHRAGVDLVANENLPLQLGDRITVVGTGAAIAEVEKKMGNLLQRLNVPNLFPIFFGILLGVIVGSIPFILPGIPQPVKLGLAGGPLIVAILMGRYGPKYKINTYTTISANLMLREVGIALFLACVGLGAGGDFVDTVANGGYKWIGYGAIITVLPLLLVGSFALIFTQQKYWSISGLLAGAMTDPPALAYVNESSADNDAPAVGYATVYPLTMFLRVLTAQLLILL
ncbi:putative transporter [Bacteroidia bacterium]|nr:putative transporter [Bacteroidia bacterium]